MFQTEQGMPFNTISVCVTVERLSSESDLEGSVDCSIWRGTCCVGVVAMKDEGGGGGGVVGGGI